MQPIKEESQKCRSEIEEFVNNLKNFIADLKHSQIYIYSTGPSKAQEALKSIQSQRDNFEQVLSNFEYFCKMFEMPDKT